MGALRGHSVHRVGYLAAIYYQVTTVVQYLILVETAPFPYQENTRYSTVQYSTVQFIRSFLQNNNGWD